ncbi:MAG: peptidoglycan DD-metalloendopeptidase family protein [Blastocatellia bacterium]
MITVNFSEITETSHLTKSKEYFQTKENSSVVISEVAREFESLLLTQITSSLRTKVDDEDDQNNSSVDLSQQIIAEQMAQVIAKNGGVGLVDVLMQQLERQKQGLVSKNNSLQNSVSENINKEINPEEKITRPRRVFELPNKEKTINTSIQKTQTNKNSLIKSAKFNSVSLPKEVNSTKQLDNIILEASNRYGIDPYLIAAVIEKESAGKQFAVSKKGAVGYMQLMPGTFQEFGGKGKNIFDPQDNINTGVAYIKFLSDKYDGDIDKVLAAYNAGPGNVNKYGGIPPFSETQRFVTAVKTRQSQLIAKNELTNFVAKNVRKQNISLQNHSNIQNVSIKTTSNHLLNESPLIKKETLQIPVEGKISSNFGDLRVNRTHKGIDIAVKQGTKIEAAADGKVIFSGWQKGYGKTLIIEHKDGRLTRYAHAENLLVSQGEQVSLGQKIATVGSTGHSTGPHLHFEVIQDGKAINPLLVTKTKTAINNKDTDTKNSSQEKTLTLATVLPIIQ